MSYDWSISDKFSSLPEDAIAGVEAPLWSETLGTLEDFEYMAFPASCWGRRTRLDIGFAQRLGGVSNAVGCSICALDGTRDQFPALTTDSLGYGSNQSLN
ncbi:MAG: hypothetical protein Ct9H300mP15_07380 [Gemmatimonadota bacterium]|nr:MAG: hypothetical protein Ct9H300mP15_07380 [Gemmatimonadota bacterium]